MYTGTEDLKWQEHMLDKYKQYFNLISSFVECAEKLQDEFAKKRIDRVKLGPEGFVLCFLFAKSYKTTKAALLLCKSGYPEDALILGRVNFEAALWALYISRDKERAAEKAQAFIRYDAIDRKKRIDKLLGMGEVGDEYKRKLREVLKQVQKDLPSTEDERKKICGLADKTVLDLAKDVKLLHLLYRGFYWESSSYTHNRIRSSNSYISESNGHLRFWVAPTEKELRDVLIHLCLFLWYIMDKFNFLFDLGLKKVLTDKWTQLNDVCKKTDPQD